MRFFRPYIEVTTHFGIIECKELENAKSSILRINLISETEAIHERSYLLGVSK